jgi:hypothetical protein
LRYDSGLWKRRLLGKPGCLVVPWDDQRKQEAQSDCERDCNYGDCEQQRERMTLPPWGHGYLWVRERDLRAKNNLMDSSGQVFQMVLKRRREGVHPMRGTEKELERASGHHVF